MYTKTVQYLITFTLKPWLYAKSVEDQQDAGMNDIRQLFDEWNADGVLITELTKTGNVHFHGIIAFNFQDHRLPKVVEYSIRNWFRNSKIIGFVDISQVIDYENAIMYLFKEHEIMTSLLKHVITYNIKDYRLKTNGWQFNPSDETVNFWEARKFITSKEVEDLLAKVRRWQFENPTQVYNVKTYKPFQLTKTANQEEAEKKVKKVV